MLQVGTEAADRAGTTSPCETHADPALALPHELPPPMLRRPARRGFFAYHGLWAPGVRLFRQMRFEHKAVIISLAFLLPLLALVGWLLATMADDALEGRQQRDPPACRGGARDPGWAQAKETQRRAQPRAGAAAGAQQRRGAALRRQRVLLDQRHAAACRDASRSSPNSTARTSAAPGPQRQGAVRGLRRRSARAGAGFVAYQWPRKAGEAAGGQGCPMSRASSPGAG
jgi:methyl-accepting chemotaxis protein